MFHKVPQITMKILALMEKVLKNLNGIQPDRVSADTIYRTIINLTYLDEKEITIFNTHQKTRKRIHKSFKH